MTSTFGWLDYSDADRRRMLEVVGLFREKGTLDELGIGTVRDTYADHFFPGTSTIQTRARYFLFIPWIYLRLEQQRIRSADAGRWARDLQARLVEALKAGGEVANAGLIGIDAGERLQRPPSAVYWQGLRRLGIRTINASAERYHASLDSFYRQDRTLDRSEGGELLERAPRNWNGSLPAAPENFLETTTFRLTSDEAEFLAEQIRRSAPNSLLAQCLGGVITRVRSSRAPWELGGIERLDQTLRDDIEDARRFSLVMEGAAFAYNLMMAEASIEQGIHASTERVDRYRESLTRWADEVRGEALALRRWDLDAFWSRIETLNPDVDRGTKVFCGLWMAATIGEPRDISTRADVRLLIRKRERQKKGALARLSNHRALERWSGESGLGRLIYRWGNAQRNLIDILDGLRAETD
nr:hypothetical protein [Chloroflexota bacterium]